jgi:hypothetical protein
MLDPWGKLSVRKKDMPFNQIPPDGGFNSFPRHLSCKAAYSVGVEIAPGKHLILLQVVQI